MVMLTVLKKARRKEQEMRVLILGLDNSGKTTFLRRINGEDTNEIAPTFGFNIKTLEFKGWKLNCWDVGGQKSLRTYWRNYFERTDAVIWVVDSSDISRLHNDCRIELHELINNECLHGVTLLVLANKRDLDLSLSAEEIQKILRLDQIKRHHWQIFDTSTYTGRFDPAAFWCSDLNIFAGICLKHSIGYARMFLQEYWSPNDVFTVHIKSQKNDIISIKKILKSN